MEIETILQENKQTANLGTVMFSEKYSSLCDPPFDPHEPKYALFTFVSNGIQQRKNKDLLLSLQQSGKLDDETHKILTAIFCESDKIFHGVGRIRGCFHDLDSATHRAETIIRDVDPHATIMICSVGVPFPLVESGFAKESQYVENVPVDDVLKNHTHKKTAERAKSIRDIKRREAKLLEETSNNSYKTPLDNYIELRVKYAQVQHTMNEMKKKFVEYADIVKRAVKDIQNVEATSPELKTQYFQAYMDACQEVGVVPPDGFLALLKTSFEST